MENNMEEYFETEISTREELLDELKAVYESMDTQQAREFQKRWRQFDSWESAYDEKLNDEFYDMVNHVFSKIKSEQKDNELAKLALIEQAEKELKSTNLNASTKVMNDLMDAWKQVRSAGRDLDDALWEKFNGARQAFFDLKAKHYEQLRERFAQAKVTKEALIARVNEIKDSTDYKVVSAEMNTLMKEWKAAGSAGKEFEEQLWEQFNSARQVFYDHKAKHFAGLEEQYVQNNELKKALIEKVREVVDADYYCRENTDLMKSFSEEWKKIGFSGREYDNANWDTFKALSDSYFNGLKAFNEERAQLYQQRLLNRKNDLQAMIEREKRTITRLRREIGETISERGIKNIEEEIEEIKAYISELEEELKTL